MLDFLILYIEIGFTLSILLNLILYTVNRPQLKHVEVFVCISLWPSIIVKFIDTLNKDYEEIEE